MPIYLSPWDNRYLEQIKNFEKPSRRILSTRYFLQTLVSFATYYNKDYKVNWQEQVGLSLPIRINWRQARSTDENQNIGLSR